VKWEIAFSKRADRDFGKLDSRQRALLLAWLKNNVTDDPRRQGKALVGKPKGFWRYRVGDYRIIADIQDNRLVVLMIAIGHRKGIYQDLSR
jgi:mRNA interferase RelE/StbE